MKELSFHYIKSNNHQEIKVDGAIGGLGPAGEDIVVSVYSERTPIPRTIVHSVADVGDGKHELGLEIEDKRDGHEGVVRVVQTSLHMRIPQAKAMRDFLASHIAEYEKKRGDT